MSEGSSLAYSTPTIRLAKFPLKGSADPYDELEHADNRPLDKVTYKLCLSVSDCDETG
jgi:hypothetical protein